eukprot:15152815-Alexandrium_andersonii.AAC.1
MPPSPIDRCCCAGWPLRSLGAWPHTKPSDCGVRRRHGGLSTSMRLSAGPSVRMPMTLLAPASDLPGVMRSLCCARRSLK